MHTSSPTHYSLADAWASATPLYRSDGSGRVPACECRLEPTWRRVLMRCARTDAMGQDAAVVASDDAVAIVVKRRGEAWLPQFVERLLASAVDPDTGDFATNIPCACPGHAVSLMAL